MKKLLILSAILVSGTIAANAQTQKTATIGVNVSDVRTIAITNGAAVTFTLDDEAAYTGAATSAGLAADNGTQFKVVSRGGYTVKAALQGDLLIGTPGTGTNTIPGTAIGINIDGTPVVAAGETYSPDAVTGLTKFTAGTSEIEHLIQSDAATGGTRGTTFKVAYTMSEFPDVVNLSVGNFASSIVYTIEGK